MRLLIFTQKVDTNDDVLGFFSSWIQEFSKQCESVIVVGLWLGKYDLPENVKVFGLGKSNLPENYPWLFKKIVYVWSFYKIIWQERKKYDTVFVHMNIIYVLLGAWLWRILGKKIGLWHAHGKTNRRLILAGKLSDHVFTSTKEGCRMESNKIRIVGQGIDVVNFSPIKREKNKIFKIISVGRISPVKDYETIIKAIEILHDKVDISVDIVGGAGLADQEVYFQSLKKIVEGSCLVDIINFVGAIPNNKILSYLQRADLFVNASHTGSLDKAMLEAMACGLPMLTCNEAIFDFLQKYKDELIFEKKNYVELSDKILNLVNMDDEKRKMISDNMREVVVNNHNVENLIKRIISFY